MVTMQEVPLAERDRAERLHLAVRDTAARMHVEQLARYPDPIERFKHVADYLRPGHVQSEAEALYRRAFHEHHEFVHAMLQRAGRCANCGILPPLHPGRVYCRECSAIGD